MRAGGPVRRLAPAVAIVVAAAAAPARAGDVFDAETLDFAARVDLHEWELLPNEHAGRLEIVDTLARRQVRAFYGAASIDGTSPTFSLLEIYFNAGAYLDRPVVRLRDARLQARLRPHMTPEALDRLARTGRVGPVGLLGPAQRGALTAAGRADASAPAWDRLGALREPVRAAAGADRRLARACGRLLGRVEAFLAAEALRLVPPRAPGGPYVADEHLRAILDARGRVPASTAARAERVHEELAALARAWRQRDARSFNELSAGLIARLLEEAPVTRPPRWRRRLERFHNRTYGLTFAWVGFFAAAVLLLAAAAGGGRRRALRAVGMAVFAASTATLAAGVAVRWIISGRGWHLPPLTNQYESVMGVALMAALAGMALELIFRRGAMALVASVVAAVALLCAFFRLGPLQPEIGAPMALLNTSILAWHVSTLMVGYGVIGMSVLVSLAYLSIAAVRRRAPDAPRSAGPDLTARPAGGLLPELDRYNLVLLQLACWLVGIGNILGAYWADRAWGRWWGWDAKETWGLMTFVVYLGVLHARYALPARRRGTWTAALSVFGCAVMGFTWWGVNYVLRGLHSYA